MQHVPSAGRTGTVIPPNLGTVVTSLQHLCDEPPTLGTAENGPLNSACPELTFMHLLVALQRFFKQYFRWCLLNSITTIFHLL